MYINMAQQEQRTDLWGRPRSKKPRFEKEGYIVKKAAPKTPAPMTLKCHRCGYEWTPRIKNPKECPKCKRYLNEK